MSESPPMLYLGDTVHGEPFRLPTDAVTETFGILSKRGVGKTYLASVFAEELIQAGLTVCVVDPVGVWWGLRAGADGSPSGLPIVILGGAHGDLPLDEDAGEAVADLVVDERVSLVLDLSLLRKNAANRFMTAFAERLYQKNRLPLHLIVDEADAYAPQRPMRGQERLLGAMEDLVRRGRARGLGVTLITQRAAVLNKDVLTQIEVLEVLRTIAPQDRDAIDAWVRVHGTPEQREQLMASLPSLPIGEAWFWSPGWLDVFARVRIRRRETFDSSATPKPGQIVATPRTLATVDLERLRERLHASAEPAEDVASLSRRIRELEAELREQHAALSAPPTAAAPAAEEVERLEALADVLNATAMQVIDAVGELRATLLREMAPRLAPPVAVPTSVATRESPATPAPPVVREGRATHRVAVSPYARGLLETLAQHHPTALTRAQLAILAGRKPRSSSFAAAIAELLRDGWAEQSGERLGLGSRATHLAPTAHSPRTPDEVRQMWLRALPGYERSVLDALIAAYPNPLPREAIATRAGKSPTSSSFASALSTLIHNGLVEGRSGGKVRASGVLFGE